MFFMAEFWVAVAFFIFVGIMIYMKVPGMVTKALDDRADAIRKDLDAARKLREEAQDLLADYQAKQRQAETEAQQIIQDARREA
ncbi:MAG TPA: F0F1 ATP synthase subunit B, partial [Hyphomicrobiaceae bacterium]